MDPETEDKYDLDGNLIDPDGIVDEGGEEGEEDLTVTPETAETEPEEVDIKELLTYKRFSNEDVQKLIGVKKLYEKDTSSEQLDEIKSDYERFENLLSHKENPMDEIDQFKSEYAKILIIEQQQNFGSLSEQKQQEQVLDQMSKLIKKFS
jgi:multidrug resistance efflux pump